LVPGGFSAPHAFDGLGVYSVVTETRAKVGKEFRMTLKAIRGHVADGRIEPEEPVPPGIRGPVVITFLEEQPATGLAERGISRAAAAEARALLASFDEDWKAPGMELYDDL
jgi:hypothetical protein